MALFKERLFSQWQRIGSFIHKNMDIVSWLYLLIPGIAFTYFLLRETVFKLEYGLLAEQNTYLVISLLLFGSSLLKSRVFIEEADLILLIQYKEFAKLKRLGYWYAFFFNLLFLLLVYSLFFPLFYMVKDFSILQMVLLALCMVLSYFVCDMLDIWERRLLRLLLKVLLVVILTVTVMLANFWVLGIIALMIIVTIIYFERYMIRRHRFFHRQLELDTSRANRFFSFLFQTNKDMHITRLSYFKRKSPKLVTKLYSQSKETTLFELILKSIWRNKSQLRLLFQLVTVIILLLILLPIWINIVLIIFGFFGLNTFINSISNEIKLNPIFKIIRYSDADWHTAIQKTKQYIVFPVIILYIVIVLIKIIFF